MGTTSKRKALLYKLFPRLKLGFYLSSWTTFPTVWIIWVVRTWCHCIAIGLLFGWERTLIW